MRVSVVVSAGILASCLVLTSGTHVLAGDAEKAAKKTRKQAHNAASTGVATGDAKVDTIKEFQNDVGQTIYAVAASHFDISPPLLEMAASAGPDQAEEIEPPENPQLPPWRIVRSDVPDPVVQAVIPPVDSSAAGTVPLTAPTTGFNFLGVPMSGATPSDSNGSVGNDQFVETVNVRYQVWNLDRSSNVATSILGPSSIRTLWNGFGTQCQIQNSGDPIVLFDKTAGRWLISQLTSTRALGGFYECVAISQTANAAGSYFRYAFAVPGGYFGDYPHYGAWPDAYYVMAHAGSLPSGTYVGALFAAMDRTKMLAGDPTATWQVILDPSEGGHMPADLDGFALPPTNAPGIFLSLHDTGMFIYRMKVDFVTPANTVRTLQAIVPVAPANGACGVGDGCIPQPGTVDTLASHGDLLMFRAAYRNLIDHESLVISHSVDPFVSGVVSGVRWYDFRLSGTPDTTCPTYPCVYQQGTIADVPDGRSRWMPSIAMDAAENILVGYSTTGKTDGSENHSIRYTGRAKSDPPGLMTVPEATIATGTANDFNGRWGDYTSMSIDPFDDCTFWYVNQYELATSTWSTRIASAAWPAGSASGQCPATTCTVRPATAPAIGTATTPADNQITVTWSALAPTPGSYAIERADGVCGSEGLYRPLAAAGSATSFTDTTVSGGLDYSYRVIAATDASGKCQSLVASECVSATATGACSVKPSFAGATGATSSQHDNCGVTVGWTPAVSGCPLTPNVRYNIFRGTVPDFVPSASKRIATCVAGPSSYLDSDHLTSGTTYYYVVRAEDGSTGHGGECGDGNEESNSVVVSGAAYGAGTQATPGTWTDTGGDGTAFLLLNVAGPGNTTQHAWRYVKTANDPGANHTPGGAYAYRNAGPSPSAAYTTDVCAELRSPPLTVGASAVNLQYWERHQLQYRVDGVAVEYAVNGGAWTDVPAPSNDTAAGCAASDDTTGWDPLSCTQTPPRNACGYPSTTLLYTGAPASGTACGEWVTSASVTPYAHRCHPITGLTPDDAIQFRWRFSSDPYAGFAGFYLDDVAVTNIRLPNACTTDTCAGQADVTPCDDGLACTTGDTCGNGTCQSGAVIPPPTEVAGVQVEGHEVATLTWTALPGTVVYDVASSTLSDLRVNGVSTAICLSNDIASAGTVDGRADPAAGDGYYYIIRAQGGCGSGSYGQQSDATPRVTTACP